MKQPSLFTDEVFKRQIVLEHVMEQVEQSKTIFNYWIKRGIKPVIKPTIVSPSLAQGMILPYCLNYNLFYVALVETIKHIDCIIDIMLLIFTVSLYTVKAGHSPSMKNTLFCFVTMCLINIYVWSKTFRKIAGICQKFCFDAHILILICFAWPNYIGI